MGIDPAFVWRAVSLIMLGSLALFFGRTLRRGEQALITRVARVSEPALPAELVRYTRRLTAIWCVWFVFAAAACLASGSVFWSSALTWTGTAALLVGEHRLRPHLFPGRKFPGLLQQARDTLLVWRPHRQRQLDDTS